MAAAHEMIVADEVSVKPDDPRISAVADLAIIGQSDDMPTAPALMPASNVVGHAPKKRAPRAKSARKAESANKPASQESDADDQQTGVVTELPSPAERGPVVTIDDFEDIFARFQTPLTNFVFRLVGNREQAADLTQDVFVKTYRALASGTTIEAGAISSWLYKIASNTATDALRRRRLITWIPLSLFDDARGMGTPDVTVNTTEVNLSPDAPMGLNPTIRKALPASGYDGGTFDKGIADREIVEAVLKRMPPKYAACLLLYEYEGFSCSEIAETLNISPSAVKMRLMRARERFITLYKQETADLVEQTLQPKPATIVSQAPLAEQPPLADTNRVPGNQTKRSRAKPVAAMAIKAAPDVVLVDTNDGKPAKQKRRTPAVTTSPALASVAMSKPPKASVKSRRAAAAV